jgi:hypothetical protein
MTVLKKDVAPALLELLQHEVERHPYRTLGIAVGVGYVLGTRLGGPIVALLSSRMGLSLASSLAPLLGAPALQDTSSKH